MDLINDLGNDLATAFLVERQLRQKLDSRAALDLIDRIEKALWRVSREKGETVENYINPAPPTSH
jgi:hypothetical protein